MSQHTMSVRHLFSGRAPKERENITDCQDYFKINEASLCFAIADGASQSFYPAIWAEFLVQHFCENPEISESNWRTWLDPIQAQWLTEVRSRVETAKTQGKPAWIEGYNGLSMYRSATSTFIGLQFIENKLKACIAGDSCLFVHKKERLESYLLKHSKDFNDSPEYLASYAKDNQFTPCFFNINFEPSDIAHIILASDALSEYILKCYEQGQDVFSPLLRISSQQQFENFVAAARHQAIRMKNDDVTLLILSYNLPPFYNISRAPTRSVEVTSGTSIVLPDKSRSIPTKISAPGKIRVPRGVTSETHCSNWSGWGPRPSQGQFFEVPTTVSTIDSNSVECLLSRIVRKLYSVIKTNQEIEQSVLNSSQRNLITINDLKQQRAVLVILVVFLTFLSIWMARISIRPYPLTTQKTVNSNVITRPAQLPKGSTVYADQELTQPLIMSLYNPSQVLILKEGDRWIKFQVELYAYSSNIKPCTTSCSSNEIEILSAKNLRVIPSDITDKNIFGKLDKNIRFQILPSNSLPDWYKLRFVGYIAK